MMETRLLDAVIEALGSQIAPRAQILDVARQGEDRIDLLVEREGGRARITFDLAPARACAYISRPRMGETPDEALRRFLVGQWVVGIDRPTEAPVMRLRLTAPGSADVGLWIVLEWLGGRPDLIVVDAAREEILATLLAPSGAHVERRTRGVRYEWPARSHRPGYAGATQAQVASALERGSADERVRSLVRGFGDLPSYLAFDALRRGEDVASALRAIAAAPFDPVLYEGVVEDPALPRAFVSPVCLPSLEPHRSRRTGGLLRLIEHAHEAALRAEGDREARGALTRAIGGEERRLMRLHGHLSAESADAEAAPLLRRQAEALLVHMGEIPRGASSFACPDPQDPGRSLVIELDPRRSASANADAIFRRARRLERGAPLRARRIRALEEAIARLSVLRSQIPTMAMGTRGEEMLIAALGPFRRGRGPLPTRESGTPVAGGRRSRAAATALRARPSEPHDKGRVAQKRPEERFHPRTYRTREGWTVLVGRSNEENDYVTHVLARPDDYWFHAHGCPGSHVVLRREGRKDNPSVRTLEETASIAAWFSKARTSRKAPIVYTLKKYVRRPRKGPPGLALVTREKLILIEPKAPPDADRGGWTDDEDDTS
jgi:hypothetical protein